MFVRLSILIVLASGTCAQEAQLASEVRRHVQATLESAVRAGSPPEIVATHLGSGPYLDPFLRERFEDASVGTAAFVQWLRIASPARDHLRQVLLPLQRSDAGFVTLAESALTRVAPPYSAAEWVGSALPTLGPLARRLALRMAGPADRALLLELVKDADRSLAAESAGVLLSLSRESWSDLVRLPDDSALPLGTFAVWLSTADAAEVASFVQARWLDRSGAPSASDASLLSETARTALLAEWWVRAGDPRQLEALTALSSSPPASTLSDLASRLWSMPNFEAAVDRALRVEVPSDSDRSTLARSLPSGPDGRLGESEVFALLSRGLPATAGLLARHLDSVQALRRPELALGLARLGHPAGAAWLDQALSHFDPALRSAAFTARSELGGGLRPEDLDAALRNSDPALRSAALRALEKVQGTLDLGLASSLLPEVFEEDAELVRSALARHPDRAAAKSMVLDLLNGDAPLAEVDELADWLFNLDPKERTALAQSVLANPARPGMRLQAVLALAPDLAAGETRLVKQMDTLGRDPSPIVRAAAAGALSQTNHDLARASLISLARDQDPLVRWCAVAGLARLERFHIVPILREAAGDADPWVSLEAQLALLERGSEDSARTLLKAAAAEPAFRTRATRAVAEALGRSGATLEDLWLTLGLDPLELKL